MESGLHKAAKPWLIRIIAAKVNGVLPLALVELKWKSPAADFTQRIVVNSMHDRKATIAGFAFIALPGGYGAWQEFCEVLTRFQLGLRQKVRGVLILQCELRSTPNHR